MNLHLIICPTRRHAMSQFISDYERIGHGFSCMDRKGLTFKIDNMNRYIYKCVYEVERYVKGMQFKSVRNIELLDPRLYKIVEMKITGRGNREIVYKN